MKYNRMPLEFNGITCKYKDTTSPYSKSNPHKGVDLGWNNSYGGQNNTPVYAINDGTVMEVGKSTGTNNCGNYIWIKHSYDNNYELWSRYCHLKDSSTKVKKGDKVTRGQRIATMGGTFGYSVHLHYEMWKVPKGWKFNWNDRDKYLVNPLDYTYQFEDQKTSSDTILTKVVGTSKQVKRDTTKNQLEIVGSLLRCRKGAGTNQTILGYIDFGIYDYTETKEANGYTWYNVGFGWVAATKEDTKVYQKKAEEPKQDPVIDKDKQIAELTLEIEKLNTQLNEQKQVIEQQKNEIDKLTEELNNCQNSSDFVANLKTFVANETGTYYIKLEKGEKLYKE